MLIGPGIDPESQPLSYATAPSHDTRPSEVTEQLMVGSSIEEGGFVPGAEREGTETGGLQ